MAVARYIKDEKIRSSMSYSNQEFIQSLYIRQKTSRR